MPEHTPTPEARQARDRFPRGLEQPTRGYRFSMDPLLLACFASQGKWRSALDLGAGCGVAGLALLLATLRSGAIAGTVMALDNDARQLAAAVANAETLMLQQHWATLEADLAEPASLAGVIREHSMDLVLANPPYRTRESGRTPSDESRLAARFENGAGLEHFSAAARQALTTKGRFCLIYLAERLSQACSVLENGGFAVKRILPVQGKAQQPARLVLLDARKGGGPGLELLPPLILYQGEGAASALTDQALAFCPFLACNAKREQSV